VSADETGSSERVSERDLTPCSGGNEHKALFAFMRALSFERLRGGTKCPTPISVPARRKQRPSRRSAGASRESFDSTAAWYFAKAPRAVWERNLGVAHLGQQVKKLLRFNNGGDERRYLPTEKRPLGPIRNAEDLRRGTAKVVGGCAGGGAEPKSCPRSDCGSGDGFVRWSCRG
jgi:hypothetical protein